MNTLMNFLKTFVILLIISIYPIISNACGGGYCSYGYNPLFNLEIELDSEYPYLIDYDRYHGYNGGDDGSWNSNLDSWVNFLENKYLVSHLKSIIYRDQPFTTSLIELQNLRKNQHKNININNKEESFVSYLKLALDVENLLFDNFNSWNYINNIDSNKINDLIYISQLSIHHERFNFIKERYAYQLIKLLRHNKRHLEASRVYENNFLHTGSESLISYWAMDQYAGVLKHLGDTTSSNYFFLKVIVNSPSKRTSAWSSYSVNSQHEFDMLEKMCKSNEEEILLFFLRANDHGSLALYEMKNIKNIIVNKNKYGDEKFESLKEDFIKVLMKRQINFRQLNKENISFKDKEYIEDLILFNKQMIDISDDIKFWQLSLSYLLCLNDNFTESDFILSSINNLNKNQEAQRYIIKNLNYIRSKNIFTDEDDEYLGGLLSENFNDFHLDSYCYYDNPFFLLLTDVISKKSEKQFYKDIFDHSGEGLNPVNYLYDSDLTIINKHLSNINNTKNSDLKEYVLQNNYKNIILERKGTLLMRYPDSLEKAINIFEIIPDNFINNYHRFSVNHNPFIANIKDCIGLWDDCPGNLVDSKWNKLTLSKELLEIKTRAYRDNSPQDFFLLATAYYNMSYFGSSWNALSHWRISSSFNGFYDMEIPLDLYNNAITSSNDDELIAKSLFMAAKCERNIFFIENGISYDYYRPKNYREELIRAGYRKNFYKLQKYKHTIFFNQSSSKCLDLSYYSNRY